MTIARYSRDCFAVNKMISDTDISFFEFLDFSYFAGDPNKIENRKPVRLFMGTLSKGDSDLADVLKGHYQDNFTVPVQFGLSGYLRDLYKNIPDIVVLGNSPFTIIEEEKETIIIFKVTSLTYLMAFDDFIQNNKKNIHVDENGMIDNNHLVELYKLVKSNLMLKEQKGQ